MPWTASRTHHQIHCVVDGRAGRGAGCALLLVLAFTASGCSIFNPRPGLPRYQATDEATAASPEIDAAMVEADGARNDLECRSLEISIERGLSHVGVFGGAVAAGLVGLYGGSADLLLGLASGTGVSYALGAVFFSPTRQGVYEAGIRALDCVTAVGRQHQGALLSIATVELDLKKHKGSLERSLRELYEIAPHVTSTEVRSEVDEARNLGERALGEANTALAAAVRLRASSMATAQAMRAATTRIVTEVRAEVANAEPNLDAVLAASKIVPAVAAQTMGGSPKAEPPAGGPVRITLDLRGAADVNAEARHRAAIVRTHAAIVSAASAQIQQQVDAAMSGAALAACKVTVETIGPMTVEPSGDVTLKPGQTATIRIRGGQAPYFVNLVDAKGVQANYRPSPGSHFVELSAAKDAAPQETGYDLYIVDSRPTNPTEVQIKVKVSK